MPLERGSSRLRVAELAASGVGLRAIARELGLGRTTVRAHLAALRGRRQRRSRRH